MSSKVPQQLKPIAAYIKIANENASRDPVVYYWCLFYAVNSAMQLDKSSPEALQFITGLLSTLETIKKQLQTNESVTNETVAQAHIEDFALKLFKYADAKEKTGNVDKTVMHAFYTSGYVMDVLSLFGEVADPFPSLKKYAKWKSTQIFACLRDGTPYVSSTQENKTVDDELAEFEKQFEPGAPSSSENNSGPSELNYPSPNIGFSGLPSVPSQPEYPTPPSRDPPKPPARTMEINDTVSEPTGGAQPSEVEFSEIRKFTKYALSAVDYEDLNAIRDNLRKALAIVDKYN